MNKKIIWAFALSLLSLTFTACIGDPVAPPTPPTYNVVVKTVVPAEYVEAVELQGVDVQTQNGEYLAQSKMNENGVATFSVIAGQYSFKANLSLAYQGKSLSMNANKTGVTVGEGWNETDTVMMEVTVSEKNQLIIKELYTTGCPKSADPKSVYHLDKYVVIYNNSDVEASLENVALGISYPWNAHAANQFLVDGVLSYENESWNPVSHGIWYFQGVKTIAPHSQVVVAINGAIDHTQVEASSVNLSNVDFACYDPESGYNHKMYYPAPSGNILAENYLKAVVIGKGNGWTISSTAPSFCLFKTEGTTPADFTNDKSNEVYPPGKEGEQVYASRKLPKEWILDAVDVWSYDRIEDSSKRFSADVDAGQVLINGGLGYTIYRNVDKKETEAIEGNADLLVYSYSNGTESEVSGSTDPSGIDVEASIKNGAVIIFSDANDSGVDFHQRKTSSLK